MRVKYFPTELLGVFKNKWCVGIKFDPKLTNDREWWMSNDSIRLWWC